MKHKTLSAIVNASLGDRRKKYKEVRAVFRNGVQVRRAHLRNYKREVKGGKSMIDLVADNVRKSNALMVKAIDSGLYK